MHRGDFEDIAAATGHDDEMNEWEDGELSQWKGQGWTLSKAAKMMWRGERDPHRVTRNVDRNVRTYPRRAYSRVADGRANFFLFFLN